MKKEFLRKSHQNKIEAFVLQSQIRSTMEQRLRESQNGDVASRHSVGALSVPNQNRHRDLDSEGQPLGDVTSGNLVGSDTEVDMTMDKRGFSAHQPHSYGALH